MDNFEFLTPEQCLAEDIRAAVETALEADISHKRIVEIIQDAVGAYDPDSPAVEQVSIKLKR